MHIHEVAVEKAAKYLVAEAELLSAIIEVDRQRVYERFGEPYLTPYCVKYLNLSDDVAAMFVRVARKAQQVPELELAVQEGLQMSKARTIASVIDVKNHEQWIAKALTLSKENLEREVAAANPAAPKPEIAKPTGPNRIRVEFEMTFEQAEVLQRGRELMSQKTSKPAQIGETFIVALTDWVDREDPVRKAERSRDRSAANVRQQVRLRDRGACQKRMPDGSKCGRRTWTDIHHILPKAYGGRDTVENLITLCKAHHRQHHANDPPLAVARRFHRASS